TPQSTLYPYTPLFPSYKLARSLYDNAADDYKLGAWAPKPIINPVVGFMGVPRFRSKDPEAQEVLDEFFESNRSLQQQTHRNALRSEEHTSELQSRENL